MPRFVIAITLAAALAFVLAACGTRERPSRPSALSGPAVFARDCSACHTLGAETGGQEPVGGSLRGYGLSAAQVERLTRVMPVAHPLSAADLRAVSAYIVAVEHGASPKP